MVTKKYGGMEAQVKGGKAKLLRYLGMKALKCHNWAGHTIDMDITQWEVWFSLKEFPHVSEWSK